MTPEPMRRPLRKHRNPERWDPERPRTPEEYSENVARRARANARRMAVDRQRLLTGAWLLFSWAAALVVLLWLLTQGWAAG